jgi:hypothetical protein
MSSDDSDPKTRGVKQQSKPASSPTVAAWKTTATASCRLQRGYQSIEGFVQAREFPVRCS